MKTGIVAALLALVLGVAPATAQDWPTKPVKIIVPFAPGSTPDMAARAVANQLQQMNAGSTFIVENKPGASGNLGTGAVASATPDGYTIGVSIGGPLAINTLLFSKLGYDPSRDIAPITQLVTQPSALTVPSSLNVNSVAELFALLKAAPEKYSYASIGVGSLSHLAMEAIALKTGAKPVHVPYTGSGAAVTALLRGDVQVGCLPAISVTPHAAKGEVKILAVSTAKRSPYLPDVPTLKESGIDVEADAWNGLIAPAGTPPAIIEQINRQVVEALRVPAVRERLGTQLMEPVGSSPAELRALIDREIDRWAPVIKAAGIKVN
jgi:tripartite-type tricarboxylate transporter receptor subunit TctC